jgi:hypothetical protein
MTTQGNGQPLGYRLDISKKVAQEIKQLKQEAIHKGQGDAFRVAWKAIVHRLQSDPAAFGELVQRYIHLDQLVHVGTIQPLTVRFSYHLELRLVWILRVFLNA